MPVGFWRSQLLQRFGCYAPSLIVSSLSGMLVSSGIVLITRFCGRFQVQGSNTMTATLSGFQMVFVSALWSGSAQCWLIPLSPIACTPAFPSCHCLSVFLTPPLKRLSACKLCTRCGVSVSCWANRHLYMESRRREKCRWWERGNPWEWGEM